MNTEDVEVKCSYCHAAVPGDAKVCPICGTGVGEVPTDVRKTAESNNADLNKFTFLVLGELRKGTDNATIIQKLQKAGVDPSTAAQFVGRIRAQSTSVAEEEGITGGSYAPALLGGALAALVGGILWGLIVIATNHEIGYMAWGMGALAGFAVVKLSKGEKGVPFQFIAVVSSLLGIVIGKYVTFEHFLEAQVLEEYGSDAAATVSLFSDKVVGAFLDNLGLMFNGYDVLWVLLAVITAWRIPKE